MENSSKALLIAAAVLIVVLLITVSIKIFSSPQDVQQQAADTGTLISEKMEESTQYLSSSIVPGGTKFEQTTILKDEKGKTFVVPAGYTIVKEGKNTVEVDKGVVITDGNSEFVWIPVTKMNTSGINEPEVVIGNGSQYDADPNNLLQVLEGEYADTQTAESFKNQLTAEFNKMVASVNKYHGFYVGRYETSLNGTTAQSKSGENPMNKINWYAMYKNSKTYAPESSSKAVVSQMIWGSQWNAMMDFIKTTDDAKHVTARNNAPHKFTAPYKTGGKNLDDNTEYNDKSANIYDLEGNVCEWTQEAYSTDIRLSRGGEYHGAYSPSSRHKNINIPTLTYNTYGSRLALYIK